MIIDVHSHLGREDWEPRWFWQMLDGVLSRRYKVDPTHFHEMRAKSWDPTGNTVIRTMDRFGVDKAIICVPDHGMLLDDAPIPIAEINRLTYEIVKRHPGRLYLAVGVDPRRPNALEILKTGVKEWGAVSLKLHPATGWYPNDPMVYPLYKKCIEFGVPVNFHTGPWYAPTHAKFCQPIIFDDVAADFPELTIHGTHAGDFSYMDMLGVARAKSNILLDLGAWQGWTNASRPTVLEFYRILRLMMDMVGPRIMFASDWSGLAEDAPYGKWVRAFTEIPDWVKAAGIEFKPEEMSGFLGGNAASLLHIK